MGQSNPSIIILGVGNLLLSDEGVGVHVANTLMEREGEFPPNIQVIEGGTDGLALLSVIQDVDYLIVVDCVRGGSDPGSIYRFTLDDVTMLPDVYKTSAHQISLEEVLTLAGLLGTSPRTVIIGVEPASLEMGMELSSVVAGQLPKILDLVWEEINKIMSASPAAT